MARDARTVKPELSDKPADKLAACLNYSTTPDGAAPHPYFDACA